MQSGSRSDLENGVHDGVLENVKPVGAQFIAPDQPAKLDPQNKVLEKNGDEGSERRLPNEARFIALYKSLDSRQKEHRPRRCLLAFFGGLFDPYRVNALR
jgi:hypothetical protein